MDSKPKIQKPLVLPGALRPSKGSKFFIVVLCLALFSGLASTGCKPKHVELPPPPPTPTPVIPPGSVVFVQRGHLVRLDLDSSQTTPLTSGTSTEWFPACSPKGNQVVYWSNAEGGVYSLWKVDLDGSNRVRLTFDEVNGLLVNDQNLLVNNAPAWSADGKRIVYSMAGDLWAMDPDGFNPETLLTGHHALCPNFSPDGKSVLFISMGDDPVYNLWSMDLTDRSLKKLTQYTDWNVGSPSYSQDGHNILIDLYRENQTQVYTLKDDGTSPLNITNNNRSLCPRFAINDRKLIYCSFESGDNVELTLNIANSNGTDTKILVSGAASPSWSPAHILTAAEATPSPSAPGASSAAGGPNPAASPAPKPALGLPTPVGK